MSTSTMHVSRLANDKNIRRFEPPAPGNPAWSNVWEAGSINEF